MDHIQETAEGVERHSHPTVRIHIDQHPYHSPNPTTGEALYRLGHLQAGFDLYREVRGDREDPPIDNGPEVIHLTQDEHFHSGPAKEFSIIVNGRPKTVKAKRLSFLEVVALAYNPVRTEPTVIYTVSYSNGPRANPEGDLTKGHSVKLKDGMVFLVTETDRS
jgi:hypothetical protein